ncbi:MAG TPA: hypothetical protein VEK13_07240 [Thermoplasmata archaeon]|nr:hypothetical protein [Thermoplasmata archaeon]
MEILLLALAALFVIYLLSRGFGGLPFRFRLPALVGEIAVGIVVANLAVGSFRSAPPARAGPPDEPEATGV